MEFAIRIRILLLLPALAKLATFEIKTSKFERKTQIFESKTKWLYLPDEKSLIKTNSVFLAKEALKQGHTKIYAAGFNTRKQSTTPISQGSFLTV